MADTGVEISPSVIVRISNNSELLIGSGSTIGLYTILDLLIDPNTTLAHRFILMIGSLVAIYEFNNIQPPRAKIEIGDSFFLSQHVS